MNFDKLKDFVYKTDKPSEPTKTEATTSNSKEGMRRKSKPADPLSDVKPPKQWHVSVIFVLIVLILPVALIGSELLASDKEKGSPVEGVRYVNDLDNKIDESRFSEITNEIKTWDLVEDATINLKSSTLRLHLNCEDNIKEKHAKALAEKAWKYIKEVYPVGDCFTNTEDSKRYDIEIDVYNFIPDETHSSDDQIYLKVVKTGAQKKVRIDYLHKPKDKALVKEIVRPDE